MLKIFCIILGLTALGSTTMAQQSVLNQKFTPQVQPKPMKKDTAVVGKQFISLYGGYGLSTLKYSPSFGEYKSGSSYTFGADYYYFFNPHWGFSVGLNYSNYKSTFNTTTNTSWKAVDSENESFDLLAAWNGWVEEHNISSLGIPIIGRYKYQFNPKWSMMAGAGLKVAYLTGNSVKVTDGTVVLSGYYPRLNVYYENVPAQGFTTQTFREESEFDASINLSAVAELGASYHFNEAWAVNLTTYIDYGLTNLATKSQEPLISYESQSNTPIYNSVNNSNTINNETSLAIGAKLGVFYDFGGAKIIKKRKADAAEALRQAQLAREKFVADSIAEANRLAEELRQKKLAEAAALALLLRQKQIADSIENARLKHIQDSIKALKSSGEGKMIVEVKTDKLAPWERSLLALPVEFDLGSASITKDTKENAKQIGAMLARHPELKIGITGHTCDLGTEEANYKLGLKRANALVLAFEQAGKERSKMTPMSRGELQPAVPNTSNENRKKNRRVVVVIEEIE